MIITISDMWKNQQKMLDNDNQIKLSSLIVILGVWTDITGGEGREDTAKQAGRALCLCPMRMRHAV